MPTFTTVAFENLLLETKVRDSLKKPLDSVNEAKNERQGQDLDQNPRHLYIKPALYATPEQAPIPEVSSPGPLSPSPYVVNHKRRRGGNERRGEVPNSPPGDEGCDLKLEEEVVEDNFVNGEILANGDAADEDEEFVDPRTESMSVGSEVEANDLLGRQLESRSFVSAQGEFFDAIDDFSSDGSLSNIPSYGSKLEPELHATRLSLLEEIEKRMAAEETLMSMRCQWERISKLMSQAGLSFPEPPAGSGGLRLDNNVVEQLSQELVVTRFVSEALGRGLAHAEAEEAAATIIESKDQEILRLRDRVQYYETVNHEMSQRKLLEVARRQQERKKRRQRWAWSFMGLSIGLGISFLAYSYLPEAREYLSSLKSGDTADTSCNSPSESS